MVKIKPLGNRVCIKRSKATTTKGGIILPDSAQEKPLEGEILEVGPGKDSQPLTLKKGDRVLFSPYAGTPVEVQDDEDTEYLIMSEDDILGILT
ncbi:MAG: 10 kDa chaperonin [Chlamydiae bacterium]|nr:10 kDa chaperonin [Chlamydiota bacterium]